MAFADFSYKKEIVKPASNWSVLLGKKVRKTEQEWKLRSIRELIF